MSSKGSQDADRQTAIDIPQRIGWTVQQQPNHVASQPSAPDADEQTCTDEVTDGR